MQTNVQQWNQLWEKYAGSASQNPAQAYRRRLVFSLLRLRNSPTCHILDLGSGQGDFANDVKESYPQSQLLGLELSAAGVEISKRKVPSAHFEQRDLTLSHELPSKYKHWATHAISTEMLEHVDSPVAVLKNIAPYLSPECRFVVTVPSGPMSAFDKHLGHRQHFTPATFKALAEEAGFEIVSLLRAGFPFMNLYRLVVILRGKKLIEDVSSGTDSSLGGIAGLAMQIFDWLFRFNLSHSPWGWQLVAVLKIR